MRGGSSTQCTILSSINFICEIIKDPLSFRIFDTVGVKEIGRRSLLIVVGGLDFGTGTTFACFHILVGSCSVIDCFELLTLIASTLSIMPCQAEIFENEARSMITADY